MKKILSLSLSILLMQSVFYLALTPISGFAQTQETLTNQSVIDMVKAGFSEEIILTKIKSSKVSFDTSAAGMQDLKKAGVTNAVILAMMQKMDGVASSGSMSAPLSGAGFGMMSAPLSAASSGISLTIPDGTEIKVRVMEELSGSKLTEGDPLTFKVAEDLKINGTIVVAADTIAKGTVSSAKKKGMMGKGGTLSIRIESTQTVDGQKLKLRAAKSGDGSDNMGSTVALTVLFGPLGLLRHGKDAKIKAGTILSAFTDESKSVTPQ